MKLLKYEGMLINFDNIISVELIQGEDTKYRTYQSKLRLTNINDKYIFLYFDTAYKAKIAFDRIFGWK